MVTDQIRSAIREVVGDEVEFAVDSPPPGQLGDYSTNAALILAGQQSEQPLVIAEGLAKKLAGKKLFDKVEVAPPGFLNITVAHAAWADTVDAILKDGERFGNWPNTKRRVQIEFISANPTGPLTLANGRGGFGGDVLGRVLARAGNKVEREYYLNDAGVQVETLGKAIKGESDDYGGAYLAELKKELDTTASAREVGAAAAKILAKQIQATVQRMGIKFDTWFSETKELYGTGEVAKTLELLAKAGASYERDGALWLKSTDQGDDKDRVLRKSDGELTYMAADLAYHLHKLAERKFDEAINIWGADHHGYVARLTAGVEQLRTVKPFDGKLTILITQLVRLVQGGQEVKMSKRAGTYVALDDLLDEVPADVARFFFVMKSFDTHMDFDLDLAKQDSQKNPVYYLKYAHARIAGILKKVGEPAARANLAKLTDPAETTLIRDLSEFPDVIRQTADDYQVQRIAHYALDLADRFHKFYERCPVISDDKALSAARLKLLTATQVVFQNVGETLGIEMPDRM